MEFKAVMLWWSDHRGQGIAGVREANGDVHRYFILQSRIVSAPERIEAGDRVEFRDFLNPKRPDLLPLAVGCVITKNPIVVAVGAEALASVEKKGVETPKAGA